MNSLSTGACCAHLQVSYRTEPCDGENIRGEVVPNGATRGWWECDSGCKTRFAPQVAPNTQRVVDALFSGGADMLRPFREGEVIGKQQHSGFRPTGHFGPDLAAYRAVLAAAREVAQHIIIEASKAAGHADSTWIEGRFKHELTERIARLWGGILSGFTIRFTDGSLLKVDALGNAANYDKFEGKKR